MSNEQGAVSSESLVTGKLGCAMSSMRFGELGFGVVDTPFFLQRKFRQFFSVRSSLLSDTPKLEISGSEFCYS